MADAGSITIGLQAQTAQFNASMKKANAAIEDIGQSAYKLTSKLNKGVGAIASFFAVERIKEFVTSTIDAVTAQSRFAERIGMSSQELQAWDLAAKSSHISVDALHGVMQKLEITIGDASRGSPEAIEKIKELGVNYEQLIAASPNEQIDMVREAISKLGSQAEKLDLMKSLAGRAAPEVLNFFSKSKEDMDALKAAGADGILPPEQVEAMKAADEAILSMSMQWEKIAKIMVGSFAPTLVTVLKWFSDGVDYLVTWKELWDTIKDIGEKLWKGLQQTANILVAGILSSVQKLIEAYEFFAGKTEVGNTVRSMSTGAWQHVEDYGAHITDTKKAVKEVVAPVIKAPVQAKKAAENINDVKIGKELVDNQEKINALGNRHAEIEAEVNKQYKYANQSAKDQLVASRMNLDTVQKAKSYIEGTSYGAMIKEQKELNQIRSQIGDKEFGKASRENREKFLSSLGIELTPLQQFQKQAENLKLAFGRGQISSGEFVKGYYGAQDKLQGEARFAGATEANTVEGYSSALKASAMGESAAMKQLNALTELNTIQREMLAVTKGNKPEGQKLRR